MVREANLNISLPANCAFIVQFRSVAADGGVVFEGRVEHLTSGEVEYFSSKKGLSRIINKVLIQQRNGSTSKYDQ